MFTSLVFGSFAYWLLFVAALVVGILCIEIGKSGAAATVTLIVSLVVLGNIHALRQFAIHEPSRLIELVAIYFAAGIVWSFAKWYLFARNQLNTYLDKKEKSTLGRYETVSDFHPKVTDHKGDITRWMTYWPLSIIGTMLNDVIRKAWTHIFYAFRNLFQRVSDHVFASVLKETKGKDAA